MTQKEPVGGKGRLLGTPEHVVDEGAVEIFTTGTNQVKKGFMVGHIIFFIDQVFFMH